MTPTPVTIDYTNWRGERSLRRIMPMGIAWTSTEWHPEEQWLLMARDLDKNEPRSFAMKDIHRWISGKEIVPTPAHIGPPTNGCDI